MQVRALQTDLFLSIMPAAVQIEQSTYQRSEHHSKQAYASHDGFLTKHLDIHNQLWQYAVKHPANMTVTPKPLARHCNCNCVQNPIFWDCCADDWFQEIAVSDKHKWIVVHRLQQGLNQHPGIWVQKLACRHTRPAQSYHWSSSKMLQILSHASHVKHRQQAKMLGKQCPSFTTMWHNWHNRMEKLQRDW